MKVIFKLFYSIILPHPYYSKIIDVRVNQIKYIATAGYGKLFGKGNYFLYRNVKGGVQIKRLRNEEYIYWRAQIHPSLAGHYRQSDEMGLCQEAQVPMSRIRGDRRWRRHINDWCSHSLLVISYKCLNE